MFQFARLALLCIQVQVTPWNGSHSDIFGSLLGYQLPKLIAGSTSFIASQRLDIRRMLLLAWSTTCASTISRGPVGSKTAECLPSLVILALDLISSSVSPSSRPGEGRESDLTDTEPTCQRTLPLPRQQHTLNDEIRRKG